MIKTISLYDQDKDKKRIVTNVLKGMRENQIDIKKWQLNEIAFFINQVAVFEPKDLKTFYNYVELAFDVEFFKITRKNFRDVSDIFYTFVNHGFLHSKSRTKFYYSYIIAIKEIIYPSTDKAKKKSAFDDEKGQSDF